VPIKKIIMDIVQLQFPLDYSDVIVCVCMFFYGHHSKQSHCGRNQILMSKH